MVTPEEVLVAHRAMAEFQYGNSFDPDMDPIGWSLDQLEAGLESALQLRNTNVSVQKDYVETSFYSEDEGR